MCSGKKYKKIKCKGCGKEYEIYVMKIPMRDKDSEKCENCGTTLILWSEAKMYDVKPVKEEK